MKNGKQKISYNESSGVLSFEFKHRRSVDSEISGNVVLDYDEHGELVRLNVYQINFDTFREHRKILSNFARSVGAPLAIQ